MSIKVSAKRNLHSGKIVTVTVYFLRYIFRHGKIFNFCQLNAFCSYGGYNQALLLPMHCRQEVGSGSSLKVKG